MDALTFSIYQGDTAPPLAAKLTLDGVLVDLSTATSVKVNFYRNAGDTTPTMQKDVTDKNSTGLVRYDWGAQDLATLGAGNWYIRYTITDAGGKISTYPDPLNVAASRIIIK